VPKDKLTPNLPGLTSAGDILKQSRQIQNAKPLSPTKLRVIEAAGSTDPQTILYQHTVFCQARLPYRDPGCGVTEWERNNGQVLLLVTARKVRDPNTDQWVHVGIPFGPKSRLTRLFYDAVAPHIGRIVVVDTNQFRVISQSVKKTDPNDARLLSLYLSKDMLPDVRMEG
jgi:hypothetical protein